MSMMSEEENIAIETLKEVASDDFDTLGDDISPKMAQNVLNVINKQQKEIEELKQEKEYLNCIIESDEDNYINKDKIRELREIDNIDLIQFKIKELLEEK